MADGPQISRARMTLAERALAMISPEAAGNRLRSRMRLAQTQIQYGAFDEVDRSSRRGWSPLSGWRPRSGAPNDILPVESESDRARSREIIAMDPIAGGVIHANLSGVVGTGLTMRPMIAFDELGMSREQAKAWEKATAARFHVWATSQKADLSERQDFYGLQTLALRATLESGDVLAVMAKPKASGWPFRLAVQLVEADRVCNPNWTSDQAGKLVAGVELDDAGRAIAYQICDQHPGELKTAARKWTRLLTYGPKSGRRNVVHVYEQMRPGMVRGQPHLKPVMGVIKQLSRYSEAEIAAAVTAASLTVFTKMDHEAFSSLFEDEAKEKFLSRSQGWDGTVKPNTAINLLPGEEVEVPDTKRPNANFDPFFLAMVRQIGIGVDIPVEVLIKHFTSSYSASRAAMLAAFRTFYRRRDWFGKTFCQPIYEEWLADEIALGRIAAPGFFGDPFVRWAYSRARWVGDGPGSLDPVKEVQAAKDRVALTISTLADESILHDGVDWEDKVEQRATEIELLRAKGIPDPTAVAPTGSPAALPAPVDADRDESAENAAENAAGNDGSADNESDA